VPQVGAGLGGERGQLGQPRRQGVQLRVGAGLALERLASRAQQSADIDCVGGGVIGITEQRVVCGSGGQAQRVGVRQARGQGAQFDVLVRLRGCGLDLGDAVGQQVGFAPQFAGAGGAVGQSRRRLAPTLVGRRVVTHVDTGEAVQGQALVPGADQAQLVGLPVHDHQSFGQIAKHGDGHGRTTDIGPGPAGCADVTPQHQADTVVELAAGVARTLGRVRAGVEFDATVDRGPLDTRTDSRGVGPATEEQKQSGDDHRLARAGLTRDHGQARAQWQDGVVDDTQPADAQFLQHVTQASADRAGSPRRLSRAAR
jgi:hypothetical protein